jgi:hypothetical protein
MANNLSLSLSLPPSLPRRRQYTLKFFNNNDYVDWRQLFYDHDPHHAMTHATRHTITAAAKQSTFATSLSLITALPPSMPNINQRTSAFFLSSKENNLSLPGSTTGIGGLGSGGSSLTPSLLARNGGGNGLSPYDFSGTDPSSLLAALDIPASSAITYDNENTKKYSRQLRNGERVLGCGVVMKHERVMHNSNATNAPKQRRILIVTDLPRLIFIDIIGNIVRGSVDLVAESKMDIKQIDGNEFEINVGSNINHFSCLEAPEKDAKVSVHCCCFVLIYSRNC